jgi:hypothetical protein
MCPARNLIPADFAGRIKVIFAEKRIVAFRYSTKAADWLRVPWEDRARRPFRRNGSAMQATPMVCSFDDPHTLIKAAHDQEG